MSLELFVNFERSNNNRIFYRPTSRNSYNASVKLSSSLYTPFKLNEGFVAEYSLNNSSLRTEFNLLTGINLTLERRFANTSSVQVHLSARNDSLDTSFYSMSAVFLDSFPTATFVAYPSAYFNEETGNQIFNTERTYRRSPGLFFYGEGHTEIIHLSSTPTFGTKHWFIGNNQTQTNWLVNQPNGTVTTVKLSSVVGQDVKIPINLRITTADITLDGPVVYYDDVTGEQKYYSFFNSSLTPNGNEQDSDLFKKSIHIRRYPQIQSFSYVSPFKANTLTLPYDYSTRKYQTKLASKNNNAFLVAALSSSVWQIDTSVVDDVSTEGNWSYRTQNLSKVSTYEFPLGYSPVLSETLPFLKISSTKDTVITSSVSAFKEVQIKKFPFDWQPSVQVENYKASTQAFAQPYIKIFTKNYFAIKNEEVVFDPPLIYPAKNSKIIKIVLQGDSTSTVELTGRRVNQPFKVKFTTLGTKTLSATTHFRNTNTNIPDKVINIFPNVVEVVSSYDDFASERYYHNSNVVLTTAQLSAPLLSPNEWVTEDTINNIFTKIYSTLTEIDDHTNFYVDNNRFYGWLGASNYRWTDLQCLTDQQTDKVKWSDQVPNNTDNNNGFPLYWNQQLCNIQVENDKTCLQKYCLEWKWSSRRRRNSLISTTWQSAQKGSAYEKKWRYEPCDIDSVALTCSIGQWHYDTIDSEFFPLQFCGYEPQCINIACAEIDDYLVIAKKTELNLVKNDYLPEKLHRVGLADSLYAFANIVGMCSEGNRVYVLDSLIPKVSVYEVVNDRFSLVNSWGQFGLVSNAYGFNRPQDVAIDKDNFLYVTDSGNKCIKKYTVSGRHLNTIRLSEIKTTNPLSLCIDSDEKIHVLYQDEVLVINQEGLLLSRYKLISKIVSPSKIICSSNRETLYITHEYGVEKYFKNGIYFGTLINNLQCSNGTKIEKFYGIFINPHRMLYICANDKILKYADRMKLMSTRSPIPNNLYWDLNSIKIHKDEFVQSWVYLKSFHRLWDNIELLRNSLHYKQPIASEKKVYIAPIYKKEDLVIGQNEIVTNTVINRLTNQLWSNLKTLLNYF